jgi:hypothetical protein
MIRVVHLGLDAPEVDVIVDDTEPAAITNVTFTNGTAYVPLPPGTHNFKVVPTGMGLGSEVLDEDVTMDAGMMYSAAAIGFVLDASLQLLPLVDDVSAIPAGNLRLKVVHAAGMTPEVDIWDISGATPALLLDDVPFGASADLDVPAGAYELGFDIDEDMVPDVTFSVPDLGLSDDLVSVYAVNTSPQGAVALVAHLPDGSTAVVPAN